MQEADELDNFEEKNDSFDDEDELDLVKLVCTNANDSNQYLVFLGSDNQYYAKNVSKIEELLVYKDLKVAHSHGNPIIIGTADIRGSMITIVNFDRWFGNRVLDDSEYELVILVNYGGHRMGMVVKSVEHIVSIPNLSMNNSISGDDRILFVTKVLVGRKEELCIVFDSDKLLLDVFDKIDAKRVDDIKKLDASNKSQKMILFADDSKFIRKMVEELFIKINAKYRIFENGKLLLEELYKIDKDEIGLIITDLEMPVMGGKELVKKIRSDLKYNNINIIVHTNMANSIMQDELLRNGVNAIIGKVNMQKLNEAISSYIK